MDIQVFFVNNCKARFNSNKVLFWSPDGEFVYSDAMKQVNYREFLENGGAIVNWEQVSFIRKYPEPQEDAE